MVLDLNPVLAHATPPTHLQKHKNRKCLPHKRQDSAGPGLVRELRRWMPGGPRPSLLRPAISSLDPLNYFASCCLAWVFLEIEAAAASDASGMSHRLCIWLSQKYHDVTKPLAPQPRPSASGLRRHPLGGRALSESARICKSCWKTASSTPEAPSNFTEPITSELMTILDK